jgi:iron complex transport system substrate-binding protein
MKILLRLFTCLLLTPDVSACTQASNIGRITVAGGSITEILYFLDMEKHIVAADITSNYPPETEHLPSIGYVRNLSAEGILSLNPTVIIGEDDMGPEEVVSQIKAAGIEVLLVGEEHSASGIIKKIHCVADILGKRPRAEQLINDRLTPKIKYLKALTASKRAKQPRILFILGMQNGSPIVAGRGVSAAGLIAMLGGINTMDSFDGWKPASPEAILQAAPDVILISHRGLSGFGDLSDLKKHPALRFTPAVQNSKVIVMDGMKMLGFGPRTLAAAVDLAEEIGR